MAIDIAIQNFRGIRKQKPVVDLEGQNIISAAVCDNVELKYTERGANVGIYSVTGNIAAATCPNKIIGQWISVQNRVTYHFVYAVSETEGIIYLYDSVNETWTVMKDGLTVTTAANGITIANGYYDWFVFTNGVDDYVGINMQQTEESRVQNLDAEDAEGRTIRGLCLEAYDGRLVTACENRVHWSATSNIFDWKSSDPDLITAPAYQEFDRNVTALIYFNNRLIVFTEDYSCYFEGNPGDASNFSKGGATGSGCAAFRATVKFDNKLFYFDYKSKNVFAYYLIDVGQTRPTDGLANDVMSYFDGLDTTRFDEIEAVSYVSGERSEIWFKLPYLSGDKILIYDYLKQEWICRLAQDDIKAFMTYGDNLYSASGNNSLLEYRTDKFAGVFKVSEYKTNLINLGSDSNLKVPKMPLIITLDSDKTNDFYMELIYDEDPTRKQLKRIVKNPDGYLVWAKSADDEDGGVWALSKDDENGLMWYDEEMGAVMYDLSGLYPFKRLQIRIYTQEDGQQFGIKRLEFKRVRTVKKTLGGDYH